ncbi:hypothetical protein MSG28_015962 [Choristoneura fumiferana]|uniref:Uncharacterized protein n=1 Tax=Choristoneura fumiferana TaxID=7141 RepID=A0ACC0K4W9_CHOFU|nr:hypothetical protein MSG28_015962 [Choristoneura fumiferana]
MSSMLCFICNNTIYEDTNEDTREKYRELVGMKLSLDSHLCHICCHLLNKLWLFKSICLRRSMEFPVLFSDKGAVTLITSNTETTNLCPDIEECDTNTHTNIFHFTTDKEANHNDLNQYVALEDNLDVTVDVTKENDKDIEEINYKNEEHISDQEFEDTINNTDNLASDDEETKSDDREFDMAKDFDRVILSLEEQKAELEAKRREDKYLEAEFKCYNCGLGFLFKDTYQVHMMRHEESNGSHLCPVCALRFASAPTLRAHLVCHAERAACRRCGRAVRPTRKRAHAARCRCRRAPQAPCPSCGHTFPDANGLQQHIKRFHLSKTSNKTYSCNTCGKTYNNQAAVRTHMIKHINKKFTCDQCPSTFSSPYTLAQHKKKHTSQEEHRCDTCNVSYGSRKSLLAHLRNSLSHQQTIFPCPVCARPCPHRRALASHIQTAHAPHKTHACALCPARYTSRKSLVSHVRGHQGREVKLAVCHMCGASFKGNSKLNRHLRLVCEKAKLEEELSAFYSQQLEKDSCNQLLQIDETNCD